MEVFDIMEFPTRRISMTNTIESVWKKIDKRGPDECWPWLGYRNWTKRGGGGYGRIDILGYPGTYAHRAAYISANPNCGLTLDRKDDKCILHKCDNPVCCNPKHLYIGSNFENVRDKVRKGRHRVLSGIEHPNARFRNAEEIIEMRKKKESGVTIPQLMKEYGLSRSGVKQIVSRRYYKDIP